MLWKSEMRKALLNPLKKAWQNIYRLYGVRKNVELGENVHLGIGTVLWAPKGLSVGDDVYIGKYCTLECDGSIGNHVLIANQVGLIGRHDHDFTTVGLPMRQAPWIGDPHYQGPGLGMRIVVEDDVWIGFGAIVLSGVRIHRGAIVAAGSVVTRDVPPYAIVAGNPARELGKRFESEDSICRHESCLYGGAEAFTRMQRI